MHRAIQQKGERSDGFLRIPVHILSVNEFYLFYTNDRNYILPRFQNSLFTCLIIIFQFIFTGRNLIYEMNYFWGLKLFILFVLNSEINTIHFFIYRSNSNIGN